LKKKQWEVWPDASTPIGDLKEGGKNDGSKVRPVPIKDRRTGRLKKKGVSMPGVGCTDFSGREIRQIRWKVRWCATEAGGKQRGGRGFGNKTSLQISMHQKRRGNKKETKGNFR